MACHAFDCSRRGFSVLRCLGQKSICGDSTNERMTEYSSRNRLERQLLCGASNQAFLGNVSTKVKASGSQQWRSQAPRVGRLLAALRIKIKSRLAGRGRDARRAMSKPTTLPKHKSPVPPTPPAPRVMHSANMRVTTHQHVEFAAPLVEQCDLSLPRENCNVLNGRG